jgi:DNA helicase HerA-like ATPase
MEREYVQVRPSREKLNPEDIVSHISSLHKLTSRKKRQSVKSRLNPLEDSSEDIPRFELLAISQGKDSPVEFFYGTEPEHLNALKNRLTTAYPASFDVEIATVDVLQKIIPPEKYAPDDFVKKMDHGHLLFDPDATGTHTDIEEGHTDTTTDSDESHEDDDPLSGQTNEGTQSESSSGGDGSLSLQVDRASETTQPREDEEAKTASGNETQISPEQIDGYDMLKELDAGLLDLVELPDEIDGDYLEQDIEGPTWTEDGDILARPTLEHGEPVAARWDGDGERKQDWMTTMKMFSKIARPDADDIQDRAPLATLIQHLAASDLPIAFQVVFKRIEDWSRQAERRKDNLHLNRDTLGQKVMYELGEILHSPSKERRRERLRDHMEDIGESADQNAESPIAGDVGKRRKLIDNKIPKRTFRANIRAISVANNEVPVEDVERTMRDLASVLDHLDGYFYGLEPTILKDGEGYRKKKKATEEFHRFVNRDIVSGSGKTRPDIVVNADELANFITVPSSENLTVEGVRGTRAEPEARDPLAKPDPDLMREFHKPGMRIGYALDKENDTEPVPTQIPPSMLTTHYGRFATTGAGKSKALINDILSLHENTDGPIILLDPKGDGMTQNYMKAHFERFGEEDFKEKVIHYPIPDILPGFTFFNINPALNQGMRRGDAIQNKADHYQELLKLVMGRENYEDSKVAPTMISALIKALFDDYYVEQKALEGDGDQESDSILYDRDTSNQFTHRHLEKLTKQVRMYGADEGGHIPDVSDEAVKDTLEEQAEGDSRTFATIMNAVFNRLNYIREDEHLRKIFNNTEEKFDFRDHLYDDKVILFDLGDLRDDATMVMTGLILTNLWDALKEADRTSCTQGHNSMADCRERAEKNGLDPTDPPCREPWGDNHRVNLIIDEAASVAVSSIMDKMLEQGRSFNLSVGLSMQFPEQMKGAGSDRTYKNVLNNVATKLIGKITLDEEIAKAMAHEGMDVTEFSNRIKALPRGEWIAQLPSPTFMETGPEPFSLQPLPIPAGHPESTNVLTEEANQRFDHFLENQVHRRTRQEYGIVLDDAEEREKSPNQRATAVDTSHLEGDSDDDSSNNGGSNESSDDSENEDYDDTQLDDVSLPDGVLGDDDTESNSSNSSSDEADSTTTGTDENTDNDDENGPETFGDFIGIGDVENDEDDLPTHITWSDGTEMYECEVCSNEYFPNERADAITCCQDIIHDLHDDLGNPADIESVAKTNGYITSHEHYIGYDGNLGDFATTIHEDDIDFEDESEPTLTGDEVNRPKDLWEEVAAYDAVTIGGVASALVAATPPEHQVELEAILEKYTNRLAELDSDELPDDVSATQHGLRELIYDTPPADLDIEIHDVIGAAGDSLSDAAFTRWRNNGCDPVFKRFYSGMMNPEDWASTTTNDGKNDPKPGTNLGRTGAYGKAYSPSVGLVIPLEPEYRSPATFPLPSDDEEAIEAGEDDDIAANVPIKKVSAPGVTSAQLSEHNISKDEARFMRAVVKGMNRDLEGYNLMDSMSGIKDHYDIDEDKLMDAGYLKRHTGADRRSYYTVTSDGQDACGITKKHGPEVGDLGADTPHRVGIELAREYYNGLPSVQRVELSTREDGNETDLVVVDKEGNRIAIIEVEAGKVNTDSNVSETSKSGIHDYESVRKDYGLLADSDGEAVWVVRTGEVAGSVLKALNSSEDIPFELDSDIIAKVEDTSMKIQTLNENHIAPMNDPGVSKLLTYKQLRNKIKSRNNEE